MFYPTKTVSSRVQSDNVLSSAHLVTDIIQRDTKELPEAKGCKHPSPILQGRVSLDLAPAILVRFNVSDMQNNKRGTLKFHLLAHV